jgi:CBS-domain-containing membrane protein
MLDDDDDTIESLETWIDERAYAHSRGALTCDMVMGAYIEATGLDVDLDEVYALLSERFTADRSDHGELIFRAVLES